MLETDNFPVYLRIVETFVVTYVLLLVLTQPPSPKLRRVTAPAAFVVLLFNLLSLAYWMGGLDGG